MLGRYLELNRTEQESAQIRQNAIDSIVQINDELWSPVSTRDELVRYSEHITVEPIRKKRTILGLIGLDSPTPVTTTRGYTVQCLSNKERTGYYSVLLTPDNMFTTTAHEKSMMRNNKGLGLIVGTKRGEDLESSIFIDPQSLKPVAQLPDPEQTLIKLYTDINDRMHRSLGWHIKPNKDSTIIINPW